MSQHPAVLKGKIEATDVKRYQKFMSYGDTQEAIERVDEITQQHSHFPRGKLLGLLKHSAVHHGLYYDLPADCQSSYEQIVKDSKRRFF